MLCGRPEYSFCVAVGSKETCFCAKGLEFDLGSKICTQLGVDRQSDQETSSVNECHWYCHYCHTMRILRRIDSRVPKDQRRKINLALTLWWS